MHNPLINPRHLGGKQDDSAKLRQLMVMVLALTKRVEALEQKRGPGRPRNDETASRSAA